MDRAALQERFGIVGTSAALGRVLDRVRLVARTDVTVLLEGESGVGKEGLAEVLHALSPRRHKSLVVVNCGAIPEGLIESELFGAEKGAYTGSVERRTGYFEEADGGTLFLDEVGELPLAAQVRLLRVLETGQYVRVGSSQSRTADVRIVAATNRDLGREVAAGRFREDLYYRLSTVRIVVPPLREREGDVLPLARHFLRQFAERYRTTPRRLDADAERLLAAYSWPGNVRELRNAMEQAVVLSTDPALTADMLRPMLRGVSGPDRALPPPPPGGALVRAAPPDGGAEDMPPEFVYRALLELRLDLRDLRETVDSIVTALQVTREDLASARGGPRGPGFVIVRSDDGLPIGDAAFDAYRTPVVGHRDAPVGFGSDRDDDDVEDAAYEIADRTPGTPATSADTDPDADAARDIERLDVIERREIARALEHFDGNRRQAAAALGISERTLYRKIHELDATADVG